MGWAPPHRRGLVRERLEDLELKVAARLVGATEASRAANDDSLGTLVGAHGLDELVKRGADARILVRRAHERRALVVEDLLGARCHRVDL